MRERYRATCPWKGDRHRPHPPAGAALKGNVRAVPFLSPWITAIAPMMAPTARTFPSRCPSQLAG